MPGVTIVLGKHADGRTSLRCTRDDGTVTWQRHEGRTAPFMPPHDLTHYAVETVLGSREAFYALVASGWALHDFGGGWPRGPLPAEAAGVERLVGMLDTERASGVPFTAAEFAAHSGFALREEQVAQIRQRRAELFAAWESVEAGGELVLRFEVGEPGAR